MKQNTPFGKIVIVSVATLFILACGGGAFGATATPASTNTPLATSTKTPRPTSTPRPTATPFPTPAPLGVSIDAGDFSFTVINAVSLQRIYPGGEFLYTPNPGYLIVDIGVRIVNNAGKVVSFPWENVYITEASGDSWHPLWGTAEYVDAGTELDPYTLGISSSEIKGIDRITFYDDAYLRVIFIVDDNDNQPVPLTFGIGGAPEVEFIVEQPY